MPQRMPVLPVEFSASVSVEGLIGATAAHLEVSLCEQDVKIGVARSALIARLTNLGPEYFFARRSIARGSFGFSPRTSRFEREAFLREAMVSASRPSG